MRASAGAAVSIRVGIVGVGMMGSAVGANLLDSGFEVTGFDIDRDRVEALRARGGVAAASPAALAAAVDVAITLLPSEAALTAVVEGPDGLIGGAHPGLVVVEASTLPLEAKRRARTVLDDAGVELLDCPLSGSSDQAVRRDVIVLASGERATVERLGPVFDGFARGWHFVGEFGAGTTFKLVANLLVAVHSAVAAEALVLATKAGVDSQLALDVLIDSAGTSRMFEVRAPRMLAHDYGGGIRMRTFEKDLLAIEALARELGCPTPTLDASAQVYRDALAQGHAEDDPAAAYAVLGRLAGIDVD